jgi:hypothetical protein
VSRCGATLLGAIPLRIEVNMHSGTRYGRITESLDAFRDTGGTRVRGPIKSFTRAEAMQSLFLAQQRAMASAVAEERRPGLFIFAAHERLGHLGRLWLQATETPRAGTIGRHDFVDLPLPADDALSLRHLLFVVRRDGLDVRFSALDLGTPGGLLLESGTQARLVEGTSALFLRASGYTFFCLPTGIGPWWDRNADDPWASMPPRRHRRVEPVEPAPDARRAGMVELAWHQSSLRVIVSQRMLTRGVLVGRGERCEVHAPVQSLSRVHVVLLDVQGELFLFDSGSTNGTWAEGEQLSALALESGGSLKLGEEVTLKWACAH